MDVRIGIQNVAREVVVDTSSSREEVEAAVAAALKDGSVLTLQDAKGGQIMVPASGIGYVEFSSDKQRPVGFAALS